jgi:hypothetical protein
MPKIIEIVARLITMGPHRWAKWAPVYKHSRIKITENKIFVGIKKIAKIGVSIVRYRSIK